MQKLHGEVEKAKKAHVVAAGPLRDINDLLSTIATVKSAISEMDSQDADVMGQEVAGTLAGLATKAMPLDLAGKVSRTGRELHTSVSKLSKACDKVLETHLEQDNAPPPDLDAAAMLSLVRGHLARDGRSETLQALDAEIADDGESGAGPSAAVFEELNAILSSLRESRNLAPAIAWCEAREGALVGDGDAGDRCADRANRSLLFSLEALSFADAARRGEPDAALVARARGKLRPFLTGPRAVDGADRTLRVLMGCLATRTRVGESASPGADGGPGGAYLWSLGPRDADGVLTGATAWASIERRFKAVFCGALGLPTESPLGACVRAGARALPTMIKLAGLSVWKDEWASDTIPVEADLGPDFPQYHSTFSCPVSKEQATKENPPMLLACGHVLCKATMMRLCRGGATTFKCPYCPVHQSATQSMEIIL